LPGVFRDDQGGERLALRILEIGFLEIGSSGSLSVRLRWGMRPSAPHPGGGRERKAGPERPRGTLSLPVPVSVLPAPAVATERRRPRPVSAVPYDPCRCLPRLPSRARRGRRPAAWRRPASWRDRCRARVPPIGPGGVEGWSTGVSGRHPRRTGPGVVEAARRDSWDVFRRVLDRGRGRERKRSRGVSATWAARRR
jgi:hypothetical protein